MMRLKLESIAAALVAAGALVFATAAQASRVAVGEVGDDRFSATDVDAYFDEVSDADIFNSTTVPHASVCSNNDANTDVDWYSFTGFAGATVFLDVDCGLGATCDASSFDSTLSLFDSNGTLIAFGDDSIPADPGSAEDLESFVGALILPSTGAYYAAVSNYPRTPTSLESCSSLSSQTRPDGADSGYDTSGCTSGDDSFSTEGSYDTGDYRLHVSNSEPLPEPSGQLGLAAGGPLLGSLARRRLRSRDAR